MFKGTMCVFCGAKAGLDPDFVSVTKQLGEFFALQGITVVCGAGDQGLMNAITDSALGKGGRVVGVFPDDLSEVVGHHRNLSELIRTPCLSSRKEKEWEMSDVFLVLPGGYGTLDEFMTTLIMLTKLSLGRKPVILFNYKGFWNGLLAQLERMLDDGFITKDYMSCIGAVSSAVELGELLAFMPQASTA